MRSVPDGFSCSFSEFLNLLATYVQRISDRNDDQVPGMRRSGVLDDRLQNFQAHSEPPLSVAAYVRRLGEYGNMSKQALICGLVLQERLLLAQGTFLTSRIAHRLLLVSFVLSAKLVDDFVETNRFYAMLGGVTPQELVRLEVLFLQLSGIALDAFSSNDYNRWHSAIVFVNDSPAASPGRVICSAPQPNGASTCAPASCSSPASVGHDDTSVSQTRCDLLRVAGDDSSEPAPSGKRRRIDFSGQHTAGGVYRINSD